MSKAMVPESIMKLFLMIAVIIVGMAFLMKAFGIDIFGWLESKFEVFNIPSEAIAVHVKFDPPQPDVWEFHLITTGDDLSKYKFQGTSKPVFGNAAGKLIHVSDDTDSGAFFSLDGRPSNRCLLFVTDSESGIDPGQIYVVKPGSRIQSEGSIDKIASGLDIESRTCTQVTRDLTVSGDCSDKCTKIQECTNFNCNKFNQFAPKNNPQTTCFDYKNYIECDVTSPNLCLNNDNIINFLFRSGKINWRGDCGESLKEKIPDKNCNLVVQDNGYRVKYGLLCTDTGMWKTCKEDSKGQLIDSITVGSKPYECDKSSDNIYYWSTTAETTGQAPLCPYLDNTDCPDNKPLKDICTGECKPSSSCTFQGPCTSNLVMNPCSGQCVRTQ